MPRLIWPNFDFEHELAIGESWNPTQKLRQLNARFAPVLGALCEQQDLIVLPDCSTIRDRTLGGRTIRFVSETVVRNSDDFRGHDWELIPWGVTSSLRNLAKSRDWLWNHPAPEVVKQWNDRLTSVEREPKVLPFHAAPRLIQSIEQLLLLLNDRPDEKRWLVKARFGMSGRERLVGDDRELNATQLGWLEKRLAQQQILIWEPWLDIAEEVGLQYDISAAGGVRFLAALPLLNSPTGEYWGSRLNLSPDEQSHWQQAVKFGESLAMEAGRMGYFGPFSVDAIRFRDQDGVHIRPRMDINARWTMGRIAYEWEHNHAIPEGSEWRIAQFLEPS